MDKPTRVGFLVKEGGAIKNWKKRWCVLQGNELTYYISDSDSSPINLRRKGSFSVSHATVKKESSLTHGFTIQTPSRLWKFKSPSKEEQEEWIEALAKIT
eukprot:TRINITY_DN8085_c0_g1_i1.p1 TRINITY_DN8085_c0_g1~~TRINITY_DN8085_c0_g1_i1.p1  ORF type:complete len:100 (-),score=24.13 TRINITY_DN8085_c0_g1_i1:61-360(-)